MKNLWIVTSLVTLAIGTQALAQTVGSPCFVGPRGGGAKAATKGKLIVNPKYKADRPQSEGNRKWACKTASSTSTTWFHTSHLDNQHR